MINGQPRKKIFNEPSDIKIERTKKATVPDKAAVLTPVIHLVLAKSRRPGIENPGKYL